jgi:hypothetical protein
MPGRNGVEMARNRGPMGRKPTPHGPKRGRKWGQSGRVWPVGRRPIDGKSMDPGRKAANGNSSQRYYWGRFDDRPADGQTWGGRVQPGRVSSRPEVRENWLRFVDHLGTGIGFVFPAPLAGRWLAMKTGCEPISIGQARTRLFSWGGVTIPMVMRVRLVRGRLDLRTQPLVARKQRISFGGKR